MGSMTIKFHGVMELDQAMKRSAHGAQSGAARATRKLMKQVLAEAKALTPIETTSLRDSGRLVETFTKNTSRFTIKFGSKVGIRDSTVYAVYVHEDLTKKHPHGQAKFLEVPFLRIIGGQAVAEYKIIVMGEIAKKVYLH